MPTLSYCGQAVSANTGKVGCDTAKGIPKIPIIGGAQFEPADYASEETFKTELLDRINRPNGDPEKLYPFPEIQNVVNNTEAPTTASAGLGYTVTLRNGRPVYSFGLITGSAQEQQLIKFSGQQVPLFMLDDKKHMWASLNNDGVYKGSSVRIDLVPKPWSDGTSIESEYTLFNVSYISQDEFTNARYVTVNLGITDLEGLLDVSLYEAAARATNVFKIGVQFEGAQLSNNLNLFTQYATELAAAGLWEAYSGAALTTPLAITSVVADNALAAFTVTLDSTAYTGITPGQKFKIQLDTPAALKAGGIVGIESIPLILTK